MCAQLLSCVWLFAILWTVDCQAPLSMGFSRREYWSGLPFPRSGHLPDPWIEYVSSALVGGFFTTEEAKEAILYHWGNPDIVLRVIKVKYNTFILTRFQFSSVQLLSRVQLFATPWIAVLQASLSITNSRSSLRLTSIESMMPSSHLIHCRPLLLLPPIPPSIKVFSNESTLRMRWPKYWSFSFSIIPSKEIPGLVSFRMDWLDLLAVQGTLKSHLKHHSSKALILWRSAFFTVQLSHPYITTGKTIALTGRNFVGKVMSLYWPLDKIYRQSRDRTLQIWEVDVTGLPSQCLGWVEQKPICSLNMNV